MQWGLYSSVFFIISGNYPGVFLFLIKIVNEVWVKLGEDSEWGRAFHDVCPRASVGVGVVHSWPQQPSRVPEAAVLARAISWEKREDRGVSLADLSTTGICLIFTESQPCFTLKGQMRLFSRNKGCLNWLCFIRMWEQCGDSNSFFIQSLSECLWLSHRVVTV